ncbi:oxygenase MpaB family protein [Streptomyces vastus]|uniref:ER-bound oxygenase mpaB/mpaB'/Rubber oxygenase catalytic domain-containing protein n=1 Tax=Streptomyces vastus TaxID=285451 RepID=A0ABP6E5S1_9ACTN
MTSTDVARRTPASRSEHPHAAYQRLALADCPKDLKLGLNLGFYRVFGIPSIARVLAGTGKLTSQPAVRAKATGTLMYTLIEHGLEDPAGRDAVARLNRLHERLPVGNDEFVYVLGAFCVTPMRWIDHHGIRRTTAREKISAHAFYFDLAERMGIKAVPASYLELARWMDDFERHHMAPSPEGRTLMEATRNLLSDRFPPLVAPVVQAAASALLDDRLRQSVRISAPPPAIRLMVTTALRLRTEHTRRRRAGAPATPRAE